MPLDFDRADGLIIPKVQAVPINSLHALVADIQQLLWFDPSSGWSLDKEIDSDTLGLICEVMADHGLAPTRDESGGS
jgi:hypothetical protein